MSKEVVLRSLCLSELLTELIQLAGYILIISSIRRSLEANNKAVFSHISDIRLAVVNQEKQLDKLLIYLQSHDERESTRREQLLHLTRKLEIQEESHKTVVQKVTEGLGGVITVKNMLVIVIEHVLQLQQMLSNASFMRSLDPTKGLPIILEDSLGFNNEIPVEWLDDWDVS